MFGVGDRSVRKHARVGERTRRHVGGLLDVTECGDEITREPVKDRIPGGVEHGDHQPVDTAGVRGR